MRKTILTILFFLGFFVSIAQNAVVYPSNWWVGMQHHKIQLLVKGGTTAFQNAKIQIRYPGIQINKVYQFPNGKYQAVDMTIAGTAKPGIAQIEYRQDGKLMSIPFELKPRRKGNGIVYAQGLNGADLLYLIMPDRFSNGDPSNDRVPGMRDQSLRRDTVFNRHGGDLKGIQNHLDYLKDLGITGLWLNPVIENDMPNRTEHGYAFTDHYTIDPRLGGETAYQELIDACHQKGLKVIQDAVYNHIGSEHILFKDMPDSNWFHQWKKYTNTNYKDQTLFDPHAAAIDKKIMQDGWFVPTMPDWNHGNKFVENYLIQHAIWTVEKFGIDAWRIDTYSYNDPGFMNRCNKALLDEFPKIYMFGETWVHGVPNQSFFTENIYNQPYKSNLPGVTDFQTLWGILDVVKKDFGWTDGVNKLYTILAQDFVYKKPENNVVFLDNHDMNRFYSETGENMAKYKLALGWLLTTRGIPQLYYGDELATTGFTSPNDGYVRLDFPGGWPGDPHNKFLASGRSEKENDVFDFIKTLAGFRKNSKALQWGKLTQYVPEDGVYVYFRQYNQELVMVIMNTATDQKTINLSRFAEQLTGRNQMLNIITGSGNPLPEKITLDSYNIIIASVK